MEENNFVFDTGSISLYFIYFTSNVSQIIAKNKLISEVFFLSVNK